MRRKLDSARDKIEKVKGEIILTATQHLVTGGTLGTKGHEGFKDQKKEKRK